MAHVVGPASVACEALSSFGLTLATRIFTKKTFKLGQTSLWPNWKKMEFVVPSTV